MNMKNFSFLFFPLLFFTCCKDKDMPPAVTCEKGLDMFAEPASEVEDTSLQWCINCQLDCEEIYSPAIPFDYSYPCFNPNNAEQLAYYRYDNTKLDLGYELWVVDFCTGEQRKLADNAFYGLDWSVKDWLVYTATDQNIWKIKSDGDSLTQLTTSGSFNQFPKWNPTGEKFAYHTEVDTGFHFLITNEDGISLDTINPLSRAGAWSWIDENRICYLIGDLNNPSNSSKLNYIDIKSKEIIYLHNLDNQQTNDSLVQSTAKLTGENAIVWSARGIIGKTNLDNGTFQILKETLKQEVYETQITVRPGGNELVFDKRVVHDVDHCHVDSEYDFYIINKDGSNQRKISLPQ